MFDKINKLFELNQKALNIYAKRQEILSANIANADTPSYKALDIDFKNEFSKILNKKNKNDMNVFLKKTSPYHFDIKNKNSFSLKTIPVMMNETKKNGNTVNMDRERIEFINNSIKYQASLAFLKNEIKNMMYILKG